MEPDIAAQWTRFPSLPGTRLTLKRVERHRWQLATLDGLVWASCNRSDFTDLKSVISASDWNCRWVRITKDLLGDVALKAVGAIIKRADDARDLVETATDRMVLRVTGHHFNRKSNSYLTVADGTTIALPVRGRNPKNALTSVTTDLGSTLVDYRLNYSNASKL